MKKTTFLMLALCAGLLSACSEEKGAAPAPEAKAPAAKQEAPAAQAPDLAPFGRGESYQARKERERMEAEQAEAARLAALKKADRSVPFEQYREIKDGKTIMLIYHAMTNGSLDGEQLAKAYDDRLYEEKDVFKRQDRIKAFMPQVQADMVGIIDSPYYAMEFRVSLESYDFDKTAFKVYGVSNEDLAVSIRGSGKQYITFVNGSEYGWLKVEDEALARRIEDIRTQSHGNFTAKAYFFAANAHQAEKLNAIESELTRVEIIDKNGEIVGVI